MNVENHKNIFNALINNPRGSDRQIAKAAGTSQPTVTRLRTKMEKQGLLNFQTTPDLYKIGLTILAITETTQPPDNNPPQEPENIMAAATPKSLILISAHQDYNKYTQYAKRLTNQGLVIIEDHIIDTETGIQQPYSLKNMFKKEQGPLT